MDAILIAKIVSANSVIALPLYLILYYWKGHQILSWKKAGENLYGLELESPVKSYYASVSWLSFFSLFALMVTNDTSRLLDWLIPFVLIFFFSSLASLLALPLINHIYFSHINSIDKYK